MRRILYYVHFNKFDMISRHVLFQLEKVRPFYDKVVLISNSTLPDDAKTVFGDLVDKLMQRENFGYDFAAWKDAILEDGWSEVEKYDWLTIMNDTCFGPIHSFGDMIKKGEESNADFYGITDHPEAKVGKEDICATNGVIPYHIMSYFVSFSARCIKNAAFKSFWEELEPKQIVDNVIKFQETALTNHLRAAELKPYVLYPYSEFGKEAPRFNTTFSSVGELIGAGCPFVKVKFFSSPETPDYNKTYTLDKIKKLGYDVRLAVNHLSQTTSPDQNYLINFMLLLNEGASKPSDLRVAAHVHAYYPDLLSEIVERLITNGPNVDFYISTDTKDKEQSIQEILKAYSLNAKIYLFENNGRDIGPWLRINEELSEYDLVGHFHTKKARKAGDASVGYLWRESIYKALIDKAEEVYASFSKNPRLGVVIPDVSLPFHYDFLLAKNRDKEIFNNMQTTFNSMGSNKTIIFNAKNGLVFPYGNMFWYRPKALEKLINYGLTIASFPPDPLKQGSVLHSFERLIVYAAWDANYDYLISPAEYVSGFVDNISYNNIIEDTKWHARTRKRIKRRLARYPFVLRTYSFLRSKLLSR